MRKHKTTSSIRSAALAAIAAATVASFSSLSQGALFGPGQLGLAANGAVSGVDYVMNSNTEAFAIGFTALSTGDLSTFSFASGASTGFLKQDNTAFTVAIYSSVNGKPGERLATGASTFNDTGGRARSAAFTGLNVTAGSSYFAVITSATASDTNTFQVSVFGLGSSAPRLNTLDMKQVNSGYSYLHSADSGSSWTSANNAVGVHSVTIGSNTQGFAYTGVADNSRIYKTTSGQTQFMAQNFTFQTYDAVNTAGALNNVQIALRAQGGYSSATANVIFRIANASDLSLVAEKTMPVTLRDSNNFTNVSVDFTGTTLLSGENYVLFIGLADAFGNVTFNGNNASGEYIFARSYSWGLGDPSLSAITFGGGESRAYVTPDTTSLGTPVNSTRADLPFMIDFTPTAIPEPASLGMLGIVGLISLACRYKR